MNQHFFLQTLNLFKEKVKKKKKRDEERRGEEGRLEERRAEEKRGAVITGGYSRANKGSRRRAGESRDQVVWKVESGREKNKRKERETAGEER